MRILCYLVLFVLSSSALAEAGPANEANVVQANVPEQSDTEILQAANTAADAKIVEPADGATIRASKKNKIKYQVIGDEGVHGRLYVDGKEAALLRKRTGSYNLKNLVAGNHKLCIAALNENHKPVSPQQCITVTAQ